MSEVYPIPSMGTVRWTLLARAGRKASRGKLPLDFSSVEEDVGGYTFLALTSAEAKVRNKDLRGNSTRPHRILVFCQGCGQWQYLGKFAQHRKVHRRKDVRNEA